MDKWSYKNCFVGHYFICRLEKGQKPKDPPSVPPPPTTVCGDNENWRKLGDYCFYVSPPDQNMNWFRARDFCRNNGGELASIHDDVVNNKLTSWVS